MPYSSTKMLPNFIELFYVTIIAFLGQTIKKATKRQMNSRIRQIRKKGYNYWWCKDFDQKQWNWHPAAKILGKFSSRYEQKGFLIEGRGAEKASLWEKSEENSDSKASIREEKQWYTSFSMNDFRDRLVA